MIELEKKISYGHIAQGLVQAAIVITALATGWLTGRDKIHDLEKEVVYEQQSVAALQARVDNFQSNVTGTMDRLQNLLTDLRLDTAKSGASVRR
jgi:hypothetical protein